MERKRGGGLEEWTVVFGNKTPRWNITGNLVCQQAMLRIPENQTSPVFLQSFHEKQNDHDLFFIMNPTPSFPNIYFSHITLEVSWVHIEFPAPAWLYLWQVITYRMFLLFNRFLEGGNPSHTARSCQRISCFFCFFFPLALALAVTNSINSKERVVGNLTSCALMRNKFQQTVFRNVTHML